MNVGRVATVTDRELWTVARTRAYLVLSLGFAIVVLGIAWTGGTTGFVPVVLSLLAPIEVLVPALAVAFGYRAVLGDARRGELDVLRTYPVSRPEVVIGVYVGRAAALLVSIAVPLLLAGVLVGLLGGARSTVFATHPGADSVLLYLRFVALTWVFALVALAVALVISTTITSLRGAIALGIALIVALAIGFDLGLIAGLAAGVVPDGSLRWLLALSPNSAYRGLVLETVVGPVGIVDVRAAPVVANVVGLVLWLGGALALAVVTVWPSEKRR